MVMTESPAPLPPGSVIGILGGGQLGRMLALAAARLGFKTCVFANDPASPACQVAGEYLCADFEDLDAIKSFAQKVDVVTFEFENIPTRTVATLAETNPTRPDAGVLETTNDRLREKQFLDRLELATAPYLRIDSERDLRDAVSRATEPVILKTRRFGYDGKGQVRLEPGAGSARAWSAIGGQPAILERVVPFDKELSVVIARADAGQTRSFEVSENLHKHRILAETRVPAAIPAAISDRACAMARLIIEELDFIGVLAVELFLEPGPGDGRLIVNEVAPRVHNSGHWTMDGAVTCQFEQHIRAICGWPLGATDRLYDSKMINLIGDQVDQWPALSGDPAAHLHLYGKAETRPGRKMGHVTYLTKPQ
jgi:5-(carboxyamino)imidazole ribonucleotide synthase